VLEQIELTTIGYDRLTDVKPNKDAPVALVIVEIRSDPTLAQ
jgi:hypothetical protein